MYKQPKEEMILGESMFHEVLDVVTKYQKQGIAQYWAIRTLVACVGATANADTKELDLIVDILLNSLESVGTIDPEQETSVVVDTLNRPM